MIRRKLKEFVSVGVFEIIDEWTHQWIEDLKWEEAFEKYGECDVWSSYTNASCSYTSANGNNPSWNVAVWVWIPGMHCGVSNDCPFTIPGEIVMDGDMRTITFTGKKSGLLITVCEMGPNDYSVWWRDESERNMENRGFSVRGTSRQIYPDLKEELR